MTAERGTVETMVSPDGTEIREQTGYVPGLRQKVVPAGAPPITATRLAPGDTFVPEQMLAAVVVVVVGGGTVVVVVGGTVVVVTIVVVTEVALADR